MKKGLVHVYTGKGKGKTTAAIGLAVRAAGCGFDVRIFQFCKNSPSGEMNSLRKLDRVQFKRAECGSSKFSWDMSPEEKAQYDNAQQQLFDDACECACDPNVDMVIMDELVGALLSGAIDISQVKYLIGHKNKGTELVITGRSAPDALIELADYVTEMIQVKHPFEQGVDARRGVEF